MKPGRELNVEIAVKVMGIIPDYDDGVYYYNGHCDPPDYSRSIGHAWEVVEKVGIGFTLEFNTIHWYARWWDVKRWGKNTYHEGSGSTAPHAICLAALKTIEDKK